MANRAEAQERLGERVTTFGKKRTTVKRGDVQRMLGKMWKDLSLAEKKPYEDKYQVDFAKHLAAIEKDEK